MIAGRFSVFVESFSYARRNVILHTDILTAEQICNKININKALVEFYRHEAMTTPYHLNAQYYLEKVEERMARIRELSKMFKDPRVWAKDPTCVTCGKPVGEFKDQISKDEFRISGMCQECQDKTFAYAKKVAEE